MTAAASDRPARAVNDPGTAIEVIKAGSRILRRIVDYEVDAAFLPARVHVPAIHLAELLGDWCRPIVVLPQSKSAYVCKGLSVR